MAGVQGRAPCANRLGTANDGMKVWRAWGFRRCGWESCKCRRKHGLPWIDRKSIFKQGGSPKRSCRAGVLTEDDSYELAAIARCTRNYIIACRANETSLHAIRAIVDFQKPIVIHQQPIADLHERHA